MFRKNILAAAVATAFVVPVSAFAADDAEIEKIREEIKDLKDGYENRIRSLEDRLREAESTGPGAAAAPAASASTPAYTNKPITTQNAFNPAISLILDGKYQQPANAIRAPTRSAVSFRAATKSVRAAAVSISANPN